MKRTYSILFVSCLFVSSSFLSTGWAQSRPQTATSTTAPVSLSIEGTVVDAGTRNPVVGAIISAKNQSGTISDNRRTGADGTFTLVLRSKEAFHLSVTANGYDPLDREMAPTSSSTNRIWGSMLALYRAGTTPTTPVNSPVASVPSSSQPAKTTTTASSTTLSPPISLPTAEVTSSRASGVNAPATNERVTPPKTLDAKVTYTPPLVVAPTGKVTQLQAIQFVQSKAELLADAQPALEQLLAFMRDKPTVEIELAGHTDNQGDFDKNLQLSKQRVELVKDYLVQNGIAASRITTRGYGPTRPIASNNSEATRKLNRRVEMIVVKQ